MRTSYLHTQKSGNIRSARLVWNVGAVIDSGRYGGTYTSSRNKPARHSFSCRNVCAPWPIHGETEKSAGSGFHTSRLPDRETRVETAGTSLLRGPIPLFLFIF